MIEWVLIALLLPIGAYLSSQSVPSKSARMRMVEGESEKQTPFGGSKVIGNVTHQHHWRMTSRGLKHSVSISSGNGGLRIVPTLRRKVLSKLKKNKKRIAVIALNLLIVGILTQFGFFVPVVLGVVNKWNNAAASGLWSTDLSWTLAHKPIATESIVFDATNTDDCRIDENTANLESFLMDTLYTGTVYLQSFTLQVETTADTSFFTGTQGTFDAGTGLIIVYGNWDTSSVNFTFTRGTGLVDATGTGTVNTRDITNNAFYHFSCAAGGKTTTLSSNIGTYGTLTVGAGTLTMSTTEIAYLRFATTPLVNGGTISCRITYYLDADVEILSTTYGDRLDIVLGDGYTGTLGGAITVGELLQVYGKAANETCTLDTANYNITVATSIYIGASSDLYGILDCGSSTIDQNGAPPQNVTVINSDSYILGDTSTWTFAGHWINASTHASFDMGTSEVTADGGVTQNITTNGDAFYAIETSGAGTIGYQKDDLECYTLLIGADTTWEIDAVSEGVALTLAFTDSADCGMIEASSGLFLCQGSATYGVTVTTADPSPPPTNSWMIKTNLSMTLSYATLSYYFGFGWFVTYAARTYDIQNTIFDHAGNTGFYDYLATLTNFANNTISNAGTYAYMAATSQDNIENLVITGAGVADLQRDSNNVKTELTDSNFDITSIAVVSDRTGHSVVSQHHNDVANAYKIWVQDDGTTLSKSIITNDWGTGDDLEIVSGIHIMDENGAAATVKINSGTTFQVGKTVPDAAITLTFDDAVDAGFDATSEGTLVGSGTITHGMVITSAGSPPTNRWQSVRPESLSFTVDHTTFSYYVKFGGRGTYDIENTTFSYVTGGPAYFLYGPATVTAFNNNTFDNVDGTSLYSTKALTLNNIVVTNQVSSYDIWAHDIKLEFTNSNFDVSNVNPATTGNIISSVHNDVANAYKMMLTDLDKSDITNDFVSTDDCEIVSGTLTIDESASCASMKIDSGATVIKSGQELDCNNGTLDVDGTLEDKNSAFHQDYAIVGANIIIEGTYDHEKSWWINCGSGGDLTNDVDLDKVIVERWTERGFEWGWSDGPRERIMRGIRR